MSDEPRRSRRRAYVSLAALEARAKAVSTAEEHETFWGEAAVDEGDDASFDENEISGESEVRWRDHVAQYFCRNVLPTTSVAVNATIGLS